ncbi:hypothetical protein DL93DRAFT_2082374 [Clavulina sp. PMI_390]|nr:hypothetical protein DL93DRAFT_2082374 [Clavulina sp. PMI_390]
MRTLSHPTLEVLELSITMKEENVGLDADGVSYSFPPSLPVFPLNSLFPSPHDDSQSQPSSLKPMNAFPSLRTLRVIVLHEDFFPVLKHVPKSEFEAAQAALAKFLIEEFKHRNLLEFRVEFTQHMAGFWNVFWFEAERMPRNNRGASRGASTLGEWNVRFLRGEREPMTELDDA